MNKYKRASDIKVGVVGYGGAVAAEPHGYKPYLLQGANNPVDLIT